MREYIEEILEELSSEYDGSATTPAATYLFEVNRDCKKLTNKEKKNFTT